MSKQIALIGLVMVRKYPIGRELTTGPDNSANQYGQAPVLACG